MKALTLTQPWASLMADGRKHNETRSWRWEAYRPGEYLAIHAAKGWTVTDRRLAAEWGYGSVLLPRGAIVAVVRMVACQPSEGFDPGPERDYGDYSPGRYVWRTALVSKLVIPVECRGALGLWELPDNVAECVRMQLRDERLARHLAAQEALL